MTRIAAANTATRPEVPPEPEHKQAGQLNRELAGFEERAKLAPGIEPTESWSPIEQTSEEIIELGQSVEDIVERVGSNWYAHLVRRKWAAVNPADGLNEEFDWSNGHEDDADTPCLITEHVRALY